MTRPISIDRNLRVPASFSAVSKIIEIGRGELKGGVVFDNPQALRIALLSEETGVAPESSGAVERTVKGFEQSSHQKAEFFAGALSLLYDPKATPVTDAVMGKIEEQTKNPKEDGSPDGKTLLYNERWDYWAPSPNFHKSSVKVWKVGEFYVLDVSGVGNWDANDHMTRALHAYCLVESADLSMTFGNVDGRWANMDMHPIFNALGVSRSERKRILKELTAGHYSSHEAYWIRETNGTRLHIKMRLNNSWSFKQPGPAADWNPTLLDFKGEMVRGLSVDIDWRAADGKPEDVPHVIVPQKPSLSIDIKLVDPSKKGEKLPNISTVPAASKEQMALLRKEVAIISAALEKETGVKIKSSEQQ